MSDFEKNKIFAAILLAGIVAYFVAFIGDHLVHPTHLHEDAVHVEGGAVEGGAATVQMADPVLHLIATADVARGEKLSKACAACHSFDQGGPAKVGPNLWGVVGGPKAHSSGFAYSNGLQNMGGSWDYLALNKFLWKPKKYIEDTKMNYLGLKKPEDRAAMIAWLRTLDSSPVALPSDAQIAAEAAELAPPEAEVEGEEAADAEGQDVSAEDKPDEASKVAPVLENKPAEEAAH